MSRTSVGRKRRAVTTIHGWCYGRGAKAVAGVSTICALAGVGLWSVAGSDAATTKQAKATAAVECSTFAHKGIRGVVINETGAPLKRTFHEHGPGTGFFSPEPPAEVPAKTVSPWCVGSRFGVEAMKVNYKLPGGEEMYFQAYYPVFGTTSIQTSCSMSNARAGFGCAAETVGRNFICSPYVGCVGPLGNEQAVKDVDVVFRVFPK